MNIAQPLFHHARLRPDTPAIVDGDRTYTYREVAETALRMAGHLRALGVGPGDRLGLRLGDTAQHIVAMYAAAALGAVHIPLDWRARPAEALLHLDELGIKLALVEPDSGVADPRCIADNAAWHAAVAKAPPLERLLDDGDAPLSVTQTSGTTGAPKLTLWSHLQFHFSLAARVEYLPPLPRARRYLSCLPLHFGNGRRIVFIHLNAGGTVVLCPPQAAAAEYIDAVARHDIDCTSFTPATLRKLLELAPAGKLLFPGMRSMATGASPLTGDEKREAARRLTPNLNEFLATAATGTIAGLRPQDIAEHAESLGRTHSFGRVEIVDEADRALPAGETGRLRFRGPGIGIGLDAGGGIWEAADEGFRDGWYYTGDLAMLDAAGFLFLKGRLAETISRGGAKIHPVEVEARLLAHERVAEAAVLGGPAGPGEEEVVAFVVTRGQVGIGELIAHCRAALTPYKVPRDIRIVAELPRNRANKIDKGKLRAQLAAQPKSP